MQIVQCAALLLPLILCAEHKVQIQLHNSKTTTAYLNPIDLTSGEDLPGLLPYGFIINTKRVTSKNIIVRSQKINIPKNARALLLTLPKHEGDKLCQDIHLSPLPLQPSKFNDVILKEYHVPIYLQFTETASNVRHGQQQNIQSPKEKGKPVGASSLKVELNSTLRRTVIALFDKEEHRRWPNIVIGHTNCSHAEECKVQVLQPLSQTSNNSMDPNYISIPLNQDYDITYIKIQSKIIDLTKKLKGSSMNKNPHIIIEIEIIGKRADESIIFPPKLNARILYAARDEIKNIPEMEGNCCNIYFHFKIVKDSGIIDHHFISEDENDSGPTYVRSPKTRRHGLVASIPHHDKS